ncbi:amidohydrolase family protein [Streptomyces sp. LP11]|uniref:Amidohydrolase family protein n=1 Tax=Streptomyces pyxinicus TaxID=2970331 RepID=A0ABT2B4J8_9ACTN|nr:amidohydrolase family protein [Streptomyces sp. LP11]MCS0603447.1 amidohydrolase family protein [Streptomyces sp. LP11]
MTRTTITDVTVFDGAGILDGTRDVSFEQGVITEIRSAGTAPAAGPTVDGTGATLLPGLIDAHVHFLRPDELSTLARYGVTTALDMGTWPPPFVSALRAAGTGADIRSSGAPIAGTGGPHARIPGFPADSLVTSPEEARRRVAARVGERVDYIKLIMERPGAGGPDLDTATAAVEAAHAAGLRVVAHASHTAAVALAVRAGADVLTHAPLDAGLDAGLLRALSDGGHVVVPTLTMMRGTARNLGDPALSYDHARDAVIALHRAGATVVAGTDANDAHGVPAAVPHGSSLHDELALLVEAGLSPTEALRSATGVAASAFALHDRGGIRPGLRADLLLVSGAPALDITATRRIRGVWTTGRPVDLG